MFKESFKYYKSRKPHPDLSEVLNFNEIENDDSRVERVKCEKPEKGFYGLQPVEEWKAYTVVDNPGLIFIRNPFTTAGQRYWITRCLRDYTKKPNKLNIDPHKILPYSVDWWEFSLKEGHVKERLRWATLGYHHNWDTKVYSENEKGEFPHDLKLLSQYVSSAVNHQNYYPEAAIVNYYHMNSTLSGHNDHSEHFLEAPLFSFSFGQSAIFLIGGPTLDIKPTPLFLHSGDIVVMSKESRLSYHGVPKILEAPEQVWNDHFEVEFANTELLDSSTIANCFKEDVWKPFRNYLQTSRININVRQVLKRGQKRLIE